MAYKIVFNTSAAKTFKKLDNQVKNTITKYIDNKLSVLENPKSIGKSLVGNHAGKWRYRVNKYRIICYIDDSKKVIKILDIALRERVYK